jgi:glycosyltransferase involved in cell wall biosynthesis
MYLAGKGDGSGKAMGRGDTESTSAGLAVAAPPLVWVVIPAYNEAGRIRDVIERVLRFVQHVVVVDDGSTDDTLVAVLNTNASIVVHPVNLGQGAALQTGIEFALHRGASSIVTFDADGQHQAEDIPRLLNALEVTGAEFALGSRFLGRADGIPLGRKLVLRAATLFTRMLSGVAVSDTHNGLRAMTRRGAERLRIRFNRMEHASEIVDQIGSSGMKYVEVPVRILYSQETLAKGQRTSAALGLGIRLLLNRVAR